MIRRLKQAIVDYLHTPAPPEPDLTGPLSSEELAQLFGDYVPMEAVEAVFNPPAGSTVGDVRRAVRKLATQHRTGALASQADQLPFYINPDEREAYWRAAPHEREGWNNYCLAMYRNAGVEVRLPSAVVFRPPISFREWLTTHRVESNPRKGW